MFDSSGSSPWFLSGMWIGRNSHSHLLKPEGLSVVVSVGLKPCPKKIKPEVKQNKEKSEPARFVPRGSAKPLGGRYKAFAPERNAKAGGGERSRSF